jgi:hypothetical protein
MRADLAFASPRKLPKAKDLKGRVVVLDLAFASEASGGGFEKLTRPLIDGLGPRLAAWVDHHDHALHEKFRDDPRFVLATKAEHPACPEMVTPELVTRVGAIDTIVCHSDFDGLCSAAKWLREGIEPYAGADADARAIDTRLGTPSAVGTRFDRALRARRHDAALFGLIVRHLAGGLADASLWAAIDEAGAEMAQIDADTRRLAARYEVVDLSHPRAKTLAIADVTERPAPYDKTLLLLLGQERATIAALLDRDTLSLAAPFDSGLNFLELLGLSGGMPTLVSVNRTRLPDALAGLGVRAPDLSRLLGLHAGTKG